MKVKTDRKNSDKMNKLQKRKPAIQKKQIDKKKNRSRSVFDDENPFDYLPIETIENIYGLLPRIQLLKHGRVCKRLDTISKKKEYKVLVWISEQGMELRVADAKGEFHQPVDKIYNSMDDLAKFAGKPIESLYIDLFAFGQDTCTRLFNLVKKYSLKVNDLVIESPHSSADFLDTSVLYKTLLRLQPTSLVLYLAEGFAKMCKKIRKNRRMFSRLDFFLINHAELFHFILQEPRFLVSLPHADTLFFDYKSVVQAGQPQGPYDRIPTEFCPDFQNEVPGTNGVEVLF